MVILALYIIGAIAFVVSIVAGFTSGSITGFFASEAGGISSAVILFALAKILENQEAILNELEHQRQVAKRSALQEKKTCPKCGYKYDADYSACPHCGHRG